ARRERRGGRQGHLERQDPDLHRQGVGRGPDRIVGREGLHAQRHVAGGARQVRRARDVAVRAAGRPGQDPAALAVADDPLVELATRLGDRSLASGTHVPTVESCPGGLVGHLITEVPGSSAWYSGGYVTYSNELKQSA